MLSRAIISHDKNKTETRQKQNQNTTEYWSGNNGMKQTKKVTQLSLLQDRRPQNLPNNYRDGMTFMDTF